MKCTKIQRIVLERDEEELTVEVTSHLEACPDCGRQYRRTRACRGLVALKRYEQPSDLRREACLAELHDRLVRLPHRSHLARLELHPAFRYGVAAAILVMASAHFTAINSTPTLRSPVTKSDLRLRTYEQFLADQQSLLPGSEPPPLFQTSPTSPSNRPPPATRTRSVFFVSDEPRP